MLTAENLTRVRLRPVHGAGDDRGVQDSRNLALGFIAWPVVAGFVMGVNRVAFAQHLGGLGAIVFWVGQSVLIWTGLYLATWALAPFGRKLSLPLPAIVTVAAIMASFALKPLVFMYANLAAQVTHSSAQPRLPMPFSLTAGYLEAHLVAWSGVVVLWVISNLIWQRAFGVDLFGDKRGLDRALPPEDVGPDPNVVVARPSEVPANPISGAAEAFLRRMPWVPLSEIIALSSEDHFVRIHFRGREIMVYGRLSDAIEAMSGIDGLQVHRSYWVPRAAIADLRPAGSGLEIELINGVRIPVSRSYREIARRAGIAGQPRAVR